jgi:hypothetical protein
MSIDREQDYFDLLEDYIKGFREEVGKNQNWFLSRRQAMGRRPVQREIEHPQAQAVNNWLLPAVLEKNSEISLPEERSFKRDWKLVCDVRFVDQFDQLMSSILEEKELVLELAMSRRFEGKLQIKFHIIYVHDRSKLKCCVYVMLGRDISSVHMDNVYTIC